MTTMRLLRSALVTAMLASAVPARAEIPYGVGKFDLPAPEPTQILVRSLTLPGFGWFTLDKTDRQYNRSGSLGKAIMYGFATAVAIGYTVDRFNKGNGKQQLAGLGAVFTLRVADIWTSNNEAVRRHNTK